MTELPDTAGGWQRLALARDEAGDLAGAIAAWREALWLRADDVGAALELAKCLHRAGQMADMVEVLQRAARVDAERGEVQVLLATAWLELAEWDRAAAALARAESLGEEITALAAQLATARGTLPARYAKHLFNDYAPKFDEALTRLGYRAPHLIAEALGAGQGLSVLDLGCGTGLSGLPLRAMARELVGVDIAEAMLVEAKKRGIYDALICADVVDVMAAPQRWDVVVAADVFVYLGNLKPVFDTIFLALKPGGRLAFTVESAVAEGFVLQESRRYAHSGAYVAGLAAGIQLMVKTQKAVVLRQDREKDINGTLWVLEKPVAKSV